MRFFNKSKGAISIFLVIILVPMMTVSSLFVDASRISLAKSVASSAGDLALNTALTNYDTVLKDMYGLFATAQDMDEVFSKLEDYYRTSITSAGVSDEAADDYVEQIMSQLGLVASEDDTADLLNIDIASFEVSKYEDGNLANPTIMKKQIVEFMKYRAPINTGLSFLSALQSFTDLNKQTDLVDKRQDYYKQQETVMKSAQQAWQYINEYNKSAFISDKNYFSNMKNNLSNYAGKYNTIHTKTIKDLYHTSGLGKFNPSYLKFVEETIEVDGTEETIVALHVNQDPVKKAKNYTEYTDFSDSNPPTESELKLQLTNLNTAYNAVISARDDLIAYDSGTYGLQYIVQTNRRGLYTRYVNSVKKYYERYSRLLNANKFASEELKATEIDLWGDDNVDTFENWIESGINKFETFRATFGGDFSSINSTFSKFSNTIGDKTDSTSINTSIKEIYSQICSYRTTLYDASTNLSTAKQHLEDVLDGIKPGGDLDNAKEAWSKAANDSTLDNNTMAKQDRAELKDLGEHFKTEDVQALITRCEKIISGLNKQIEEIDKYKYAGTNLTEITDYSAFERIVGNKYGSGTLEKITTNENELNNKISEWWNAGVFQNGNVDISWVNQSGSKANLREDKLKFYTYLYQHFHDSAFSETTNEVAVENTTEKQNYEDTKEALSSGANEKAKDTPTIAVSGDISKQPNLPSDGKAGKTPAASKNTGNSDAAEKTSSSLSSMFKDLAGALVNMATGLRDDLYVSDYIMSMFSYDTFEKEAKYDALDESVQKDYNSVKAAEIPETADLTSLTKEDISADNNFAYGGEIEYILYGGSDTTNKVASYGSIFAIRLGFNLVYAFTDSEIRDGALAIATPISAATLGVIPAPLIQAAIVIGISIAESSIDLMCLREGMKVPLYKNKNTWNISFTNLSQQLGSAAKNLVQPAINKAIDSSVEYLDSWLDKTEEELNNLTEEELTKLGNSVQSSFETMIEREAGIVIQKVTTLVENGIEECLTTEDEIVNYVNTNLNEWLASSNEDKSSMSYQVKEKAVSVICEASGQYIKDIYNGIRTASSNATSSAGVALNDIFGKVRDAVEGKVKGLTSNLVASAKSEIKDAAKNGASKLKDTINGKVDQLCGSGTGNPEVSGISSMLSFQYSDYLRLFLIVGLITNEQSIILRTADVIQVNMAQKLTDDKDYQLKLSATYVQINASLQVKPLMMALPLFSEVKNNPKDNTNWYSFEYSAIRGY